MSTENGKALWKIKSVFFFILQLDPAISLLRQPEIDGILCLGEAPTR